MIADLACDEAVVRAGIEEPCDRSPVGYRLDPTEGSPYPVCRKHHRPPYWLTARAEAAQARGDGVREGLARVGVVAVPLVGKCS